MNNRLHHTPGYGGFVPQFKYKIGRTYGATTTELLEDSTVAKSELSVLSSTKHDLPTIQDRDASKKRHLMGDVKLTSPMTPGYTGYIPRLQHHFGRRYAEASEIAIMDHDNVMMKQKEADYFYKNMDQSAGNSAGIQIPLRPIAKEARPYRSKNTIDTSVSPLFMPEGHPGKFYACGYTGYIPRHRDELGKSYRETTQSALRRFGVENKNLRALTGKPVVIQRQKEQQLKPVVEKQRIIPPPGYTGFIPGKEPGVLSIGKSRA